MNNASLFKRVVLRFVRAFVGGFVAGLVVLLQQQPAVIDLSSLLQPLLFAGIVGGLLAVDKAFRG